MNLKRKLYDFLISTTTKIRWIVLSSLPSWKGITDKKYEDEIIVSLTSFPPRINDVIETIKTILTQSVKPNRVILWLASSQFPEGDYSLPKQLLNLKKFGLEIEWCEDLKSYKKLIPTLKKYPESVVITADDDLIYKHNWLKKLFVEYKRNPNVIWVHRVTKFEYNDGKYITRPGGFNRWPNYSYLNKLTGCGGVLYPPKIFDAEILNINKFKEICPTNDDIWFWLMAVKNNVKLGVPDKPDLRLVYVGKTQDGESLSKINDHGKHLFWKDFYNVLEEYPEIEERFQNELKERNEEYSG